MLKCPSEGSIWFSGDGMGTNIIHIWNITKVLGKVFECECCGKILKNTIWKVLRLRFWVWSIVKVLKRFNLVVGHQQIDKKGKLGHYLTLGFKKWVRKKCEKTLKTLLETLYSVYLALQSSTSYPALIKK